MAKKKKISHEEYLKLEMEHYIQMVRMEGVHAGTFWQPRMDEILPFYLEYLKEHPDDLRFVLKGYAWHSFNYALKQR